jgi:hypothetical protein
MFDQYFGPAKAALEQEAAAKEAKAPSQSPDALDEMAQQLQEPERVEEIGGVDLCPERDSGSKQPEQAAETPDNSTGVELTCVISTDVNLSSVDSARSKMDIKSNFVKVDMNVLDTLLPTLDASAQAVYMRLYRLSWGFRECACEVTVKSLSRACNMSPRTVQRAIDRLVELRYIEHRIQKSPGLGNLYRVYLPHEIPGLAEKIARVPEVEHTFQPVCGKRGPVKKTGVNLSETGATLTPVNMAYVGPIKPGAGSSETPDKMTPDKMTPITEVHVDIDNNNRDEVAVVEDYLQTQGLSVPRSRLLSWVSDGITLRRIREAVLDVKGWANNPTGALIDTIENRREVSPAAIEAAASSEAAMLQAAEEAKRQREEEEWLATEMARIGPTGMKKMREQAEAECKNNWVYQKTEIEAIKQSIVDSKVKEMLLSQRQ